MSVEAAAVEIDIDLLHTWIGREERASDTITAGLAARFSATFGRDARAVCDGDVVHGLLHWCLASPVAATDALGEDGHPQKGGFLPPVPLPRRMWAGGSLRFKEDARVGDTVERVSRIADVVLKRGRAGPLCFVTVEHLERDHL